MIPLPPYVPVSLRQAPIDFEWRGAERHAGPVNAKTPLLNRLDNTTLCGQLTLCAGLLNWAAVRLMAHTHEAADALELAEAAFAYQIDWRYADPRAGGVRTAPDDPPALSALMEVAVYLWRSMDKAAYWDSYYAPVRQTFHAAHVVKHLMPAAQRPAFIHWFEQAIDRVQTHARAPEESPRARTDFATEQDWQQFIARHRGKALPQELLDTAVPYDDAQRDTLLAGFLARLQGSGNRYLRTPEAMRRLGFKGVPYQLPQACAPSP